MEENQLALNLESLAMFLYFDCQDNIKHSLYKHENIT